jgi:hypothetical protein
MVRAQRRYRVYPDTSVLGGIHDKEYEKPSLIFFDLVRQGSFMLVLSDLVADEVRNAPDPVRKLFEEIAPRAEWVEVSKEVLALREAYLRAGVVSERWSADALHVALATVSRCDLIVSWNFRHIVHFQKVPLYNAVNRLEGYAEIGIYTPEEAIPYEENL